MRISWVVQELVGGVLYGVVSIISCVRVQI